ncbi:MAG: hypothetical protein WB588_11140 [Dehalococcoidia bacterium]|jgi:hypothetical protein
MFDPPDPRDPRCPEGVLACPLPEDDGVDEEGVDDEGVDEDEGCCTAGVEV